MQAERPFAGRSNGRASRSTGYRRTVTTPQYPDPSCLIRLIARHSGIDRTTACGRPGKRFNNPYHNNPNDRRQQSQHNQQQFAGHQDHQQGHQQQSRQHQRSGGSSDGRSSQNGGQGNTQGLTQEARRRGGKHSAQEQERDESGQFTGDES
jgi:hypothetical protein